MKKLFSIGLGLLVLAATGYTQQKLPLRISVHKNTETDRTTLQKGRSYSSGCTTTHFAKVTKKTEAVSVDISLLYMGAKETKGLKLVYYVVGRDKQSRDLKLAAKGETTVDLKPPQTSVVTTDPVEFGEYDVKYVTGYASPSNRKQGFDYYGIAVQVFQADSAIPVAEFYEPATLDHKISELVAAQAAPKKGGSRKK